MNRFKKIKIDTSYIYVILCLLCGFFVVYAFTGVWPNSTNNYNSFSLQAQSWLEGRLDLGQNYSYLELAVYQGKYFVSFPPFVSYIMLLFVPFFGANTPDNWITLGASVVSAVYAVKLYKLMRNNDNHAIFMAVFLLLGCNTLFCSVNGWVWFIAQNFAFMFTIMSAYYAEKGKLGLSLSFLACAVGCRPFQIVYAPVVLIICYMKWKNNCVASEHDKKIGILYFISKKWTSLIAPFIIGSTYMILNYARFGSIFEFGHNYLPEFTDAPEGQFSFSYILANLPSLFKIPGLTEQGKLAFPTFNGMSIFLISPIFITFIIYFVYNIIQNVKSRRLNNNMAADLIIEDRLTHILTIVIPIIFVLHTIFIIAHKTMGGWHFGNRYMNDLLPFIYYAVLRYMPADDSKVKWNYPLCCFGICLNIVGTIATYNYWIQ